MLLPHTVAIAVTVIIAAGSALLFGYWFRYTCVLILSAKTACDYAAAIAAANQLNFPAVQASLREHSHPDLDRLHAALDKDYSLVTYLLKNAAQAGTEESSVEARMLALHYRLTSVWYQISRPMSTEAARRALEEMSAVVAHFANVMGERAACGAAA